MRLQSEHAVFNFFSVVEWTLFGIARKHCAASPKTIYKGGLTEHQMNKGGKFLTLVVLNPVRSVVLTPAVLRRWGVLQDNLVLLTELIM